MSRRLATIAQAAKETGKSYETIRRHISLGYFPVYRVPGQRAALVDLDEVAAAYAELPASKVRRSYGFAAARTLSDEDLKDAEVER